ncbi:MAG: N-acetylmuramoyl-L-alanine amidase [Bacteroidales bacterium]|nr:N-acetylmuramoyl-L-alanine amidase [Bacteroidales bacterium]
MRKSFTILSLLLLFNLLFITLPILASNSIRATTDENVVQQSSNAKGYETLFGKKNANFTKSSTQLKNAVFYLVCGHGGPDPGAIGNYKGHQLHEDEYAYDIILRLGRELMMNGAKVHFIIQDPKDGIREDEVLKNSKNETCMGKAIPLGQLDRLKQRCEAINQLFRKEKALYKRAVFIHVDSRAKGKQTDVFFYHALKSEKGKQLALSIQRTFNQKYDKHQPNRGFDGSVSSRNLYVLQNSTPVAVFLELGNIQNYRDQQRLVLSNNRQALARWITEGIIADYKKQVKTK